MKKLLSLLFILGSVSMLANEMEGVDPALCFDKACNIKKDFKINVRVPEQLQVKSVNDINLVWCGDSDINYSEVNHHTLKGEKGKTVLVGFKSEGELGFKKGSDLLPAFTGKITHKTGSVKLDETTGEGSGGIDLIVRKNVGTTLLTAGETYRATAILVAAYDTSGWNQ